MTFQQLEQIQAQIFFTKGIKCDIIHDEKYRGWIAFQSGTFTIVSFGQY